MNTFLQRGKYAAPSGPYIPKAGSPRRRQYWVVLLLLFGVSLIPFSKMPMATAAAPAALLLLPTLPTGSPRRSVLWRFLLLSGVGACGAFVSGLVSGDPLVSVMGSAVVLPFIGVLALVIDRYAAAGSSKAGLAVIILAWGSHAVFYLIHPTAEANVDIWKFAVGAPVTVLTALGSGLLWSRGQRLGAVLFLGALGLLNVILGFRSLGGIAFFVAVFLAFSLFMRSPGIFAGLSKFAAVALVAVLASGLYGHLAGSGALGTEQRDKYLYAEATDAGILVSGRPELVISLTAIQRSPWVGAGPRAEVDYSTAMEGLRRAHALGLSTTIGQQVRLVGSGLNSHSIGFGAWVRGGVLEFIPWLFVMMLCIKLFLRPPEFEDVHYPVGLLWAGIVMWDVLFSPAAPHYGVVIAGFLAFAHLSKHSNKVAN